MTGIGRDVIVWIRLLRMLKIYRVIELIYLLLKHKSINIPIFRICLLSVILIVFSHWANCALCFIAEAELHAHSRFDGKNILEIMTHHPFTKNVMKKPEKLH